MNELLSNINTAIIAILIKKRTAEEFIFLRQIMLSTQDFEAELPFNSTLLKRIVTISN